ncbi:MAG: hypothetical protein ABSE93_02765 [Terriglobia bacterium]|jgi:hypothetical protein
MTPIEHITASLHFALALFLFWTLCFHYWRRYRVDALRERLFQIRGELFDFAANGAISFDDPAYGQLRAVMNGMLRFAHKFTFSRLAMVLVLRKKLERLHPGGFLADWGEAVSRLPEGTQKSLREFHGRMIAAIAWHIVSGSPVLWIFFACLAFRLLAGGKAGRLEEVSSQLPGVDIVEAQAINIELQGSLECA